MNNKQGEVISSLMSTFMSVAALVYMFVMGMYTEGNPERVTLLMMVPPLALLAGAMFLILKPAKVEF